MWKFTQIIFRPTSENSEEMHQNYFLFRIFSSLRATISEIKYFKLRKTRNTKYKFNDLSSLSVGVDDSESLNHQKCGILVVKFDQFLNFDDYISGVCRSTHFHLRNIGKIRHLLSYEACAQLIHALISMRLDSCNSLPYNLPKSGIERLQKIQNQAARILAKTPRRDQISEVLVSLHWLRIEQRIVYKILILTYKAFVAPVYLSELLNKKSTSANTRSTNDDFF